MAQLLTVVSLLALAGLLAWGHAERLSAWWDRAHFSGRRASAIHVETIQRPIYKASAHDFLRGAADLTFGAIILCLGFFLLMWLIATG
jgi:hypothetical protein